MRKSNSLLLREYTQGIGGADQRGRWFLSSMGSTFLGCVDLASIILSQDRNVSTGKQRWVAIVYVLDFIVMTQQEGLKILKKVSLH